MKIDTENNLLSVLLVAGIGVLAVLGLLFFLLLGRANVESIAPAGAPESSIDRVVAESPELGELSQYAAIIERPVFFADRQLPIIELAGDDADAVEDEPEPVVEVEIPELGASIAGIIITPEVKLAMITDDANNETQVLREGMTMPGDKSAWKIAEIRPRGVQFETDGGRVENLELEVATGALKTGAPPRRQASASTGEPSQESEGAAVQENAESDDAQAQARERAEEIRRRVAERRAQLRAEAERRAREQDDGG